MALSLTAEKARTYGAAIEGMDNDLVVKLSTTVYSGQVLATDVATHAGLVLPFDNAGTWDTPVFMGFALDSLVQTASSTNRVKGRQAGTVFLPTITGASSAASLGVTVYAANDDTFTLTDTNNIAIGKISAYVAGEGFQVDFEAANVRSI